MSTVLHFCKSRLLLLRLPLLFQHKLLFRLVGTDKVHLLLTALEKAAASCKPSGSGEQPAGREVQVNVLSSQLRLKCEENKQLAARLEKADCRFDRLQTEFISLRQKLQAANKEIEVLTDTSVSHQIT